MPFPFDLDNALLIHNSYKAAQAKLLEEIAHHHRDKPAKLRKVIEDALLYTVRVGCIASHASFLESAGKRPKLSWLSTQEDLCVFFEIRNALLYHEGDILKNINQDSYGWASGLMAKKWRRREENYFYLDEKLDANGDLGKCIIRLKDNTIDSVKDLMIKSLATPA